MKSGDTIYRQDAIDAVKKNTFRLTFAEEQNCEGHVAWSANAVYSDVIEGALLELPSAQSKLYGYDIRILALVAEIMRKNDIGPEEALCIFRDNQKIAEMIRGEFRETVREQIKQIFPDAYVHIKDGDQHEGRQINKP